MESPGHRKKKRLMGRGIESDKIEDSFVTSRSLGKKTSAGAFCKSIASRLGKIKKTGGKGGLLFLK